jgi:hypothetical protein
MAPKTASLRRAGVVDDLKFKWCQRCIRRLSVRRLPLARYSQLTRQSVHSDSEVVQIMSNPCEYNVRCPIIFRILG